MKVKDLIAGIDCSVFGQEDIDVLGLYHNSKEVKEKGVFFAISGGTVDGKDFIDEAISNGAEVVISDKKIIKEGITNIVVNDVRKTMSLMASKFYGEPSKTMFIIGITGTNGKTTSTYMLESIYKQSGAKVGVIGTNGIVINGQKFKAEMTTPDPIILQKTLAKMRDNDVDVVIMEVSAHALKLQKLWGVMTDIAVFTNLSQDHLDFFLTMQNYASAKKSFFDPKFARFGVVNLDDELGKEIFENAKIPILTYSRDVRLNTNSQQVADIIIKKEKHNITNQEIIVQTPKGCKKIKLNLMGGFNVSNALGAIATAIMSGISLDVIASGLENLKSVDGRFNTYDVGGVRVIIDYAHTPDGLKNILEATREITKGKIYSVFGCGGNRDQSKRHQMGSVSESLADYTIITSDNPRFEKPEDIAKQIELGLSQNYSICLDREKAIKLAIAMAKPDDSVVIAGKGAEDYLEVLGHKIAYSDKSVIEEIMASLEKK